MNSNKFHATPKMKKDFSICESKGYNVYPIPLPLEDKQRMYRIGVSEEGKAEKVGINKYNEDDCWIKIFELYAWKIKKEGW